LGKNDIWKYALLKKPKSSNQNTEMNKTSIPEPPNKAIPPACYGFTDNFNIYTKN